MSRQDRRFCILIFLAAMLFRAALILMTESYRDINHSELERVAVSVATEGVHGNPYSVPTGPTAHITPGYAWILAVVYRLFGTGVPAEIVKQGLCCLVCALRVALLPWFALRTGLSRSVAMAAGIIGIFWIAALETELVGDWEAPYVALGLLLLTQYHFRNPLRELTLMKACVLGVCWGVLTLFLPAVLPIAAGFCAVELFGMRRADWGRYAMRAAAVAVCGFLTLLPWAIRNERVLGKWIFTKDNFGLEMWVAYHPNADWNMGASSKQPGIHPFTDVGEAYAVARMGEIAYNQQKFELAKDWIREHPDEAGELFMLHLLHFWFPWARNTAHEFVQVTFNVLAGVGFVILAIRHRKLALYVGSALLLFPLVYYVISASARYRYPIDWMMVVLMGVTVGTAVEAVWRRWKSGRLTHVGEETQVG